MLLFVCVLPCVASTLPHARAFPFLVHFDKLSTRAQIVLLVISSGLCLCQSWMPACFRQQLQVCTHFSWNHSNVLRRGKLLRVPSIRTCDVSFSAGGAPLYLFESPRMPVILWTSSRLDVSSKPAGVGRHILNLGPLPSTRFSVSWTCNVSDFAQHGPKSSPYAEMLVLKSMFTGLIFHWHLYISSKLQIVVYVKHLFVGFGGTTVTLKTHTPSLWPWQLSANSGSFGPQWREAPSPPPPAFHAAGWLVGTKLLKELVATNMKKQFCWWKSWWKQHLVVTFSVIYYTLDENKWRWLKTRTGEPEQFLVTFLGNSPKANGKTNACH